MYDALFEQAQRIAVVRFATEGPHRPWADEGPAELPQDIAKLSPRIRFYRLNNVEKDEWTELYTAFAQPNARANFGPWRRVLSVLRGNDAVVCVVERHYICLDYKSELLTFYSQLDAARSVPASRLHFFAANVDEGNLWNLPNEVRDSYLGYVVCRPGRLPLVGRTVIKPPRYLTDNPDSVCATVEEKVNFFGQKLTVVGTPFMQQDEGLAACSEVTLWASTYQYFRRGAIQRRLVADIADLAHPTRPMTPYATSGLGTDDVNEILRAVGLRGKVYLPPFDTNTVLTPVSASSIDGVAAVIADIQRELRRMTVQMVLGRRVSRRLPPTDDLVIYSAALNDLIDRQGFGGSIKRLSVRLMDMLLAHNLKPYLRSRIPAYMATQTHAMLLVGAVDCERRTRFVVHDDQNGPYLAMTSLIDGSLKELEYQAFSELETERREQRIGDLRDRAVDVLNETGDRPSRMRSGSEFSRRVEEIVVPLPARFFADPNVVVEDARQMIANAGKIAEAETGLAEKTDWSVNAMIAMGIDYKRDRCGQLSDPRQYASRQAIGSVHLSEWVIVVEGCARAESDRVAWEFVYDGTASTAAPIVQLARIGKYLIAGHPASEGKAEGLTLGVNTFLPFQIESQLGKY